MESLGERLKSAREQKGYTFDQIARDTNIARRYLEALENEDFALFPGEPYLLGFLRNYGEYLGLNVQDLISAYRTIKIQEQPIPVEQLLMKSKPSPVVVGGIVVGAVAAIGVLLAVILISRRPIDGAQAIERKPTEYALTDGAIEKRLYSGDSVVVSVGNAKYKVAVAKLGESLTLATPGGDSIFELGQEGAVDLNGDGVSDLRVFVADLFKNDPTKGVSLRLEVLAGAAAAGVASSGLSGQGGEQTTAAQAAVADAVTTAEVADASIAAVAAGPVIFSSPNPYPFTLQATFKGFCMFRWESDRKDREEKYFHKAEILNIQAQNGIRLWLSNAGAVKLVAIGGGKTVDLEIGGAGEVVVTDVKWVKDEDGRFKLTTVRLD